MSTRRPPFCRHSPSGTITSPPWRTVNRRRQSEDESRTPGDGREWQALMFTHRAHGACAAPCLEPCSCSSDAASAARPHQCAPMVCQLQRVMQRRCHRRAAVRFAGTYLVCLDCEHQCRVFHYFSMTPNQLKSPRASWACAASTGLLGLWLVLPHSNSINVLTSAGCRAPVPGRDAVPVKIS